MTFTITDNSPVYIGITPAGSEWFYYPKGKGDQERLLSMFTAFCRLWRKHDERVGAYSLTIVSDCDTFSAPLADATKMMLKYEDIRREGENPQMTLTVKNSTGDIQETPIVDFKYSYRMVNIPKHIRKIIKWADENKIESRNWNWYS